SKGFGKFYGDRLHSDMVLRFCCLSNTDHRRRGKDRRTREESGELTLASPLDGALCRLVCWTRRSCLRHVLRQPRVGEPCANGNGIGSIHVPALVGTSCASVLALQWKTCRHGEETGGTGIAASHFASTRAS